MNLRSAPLRFVAGVLALWVGGRVALVAQATWQSAPVDRRAAAKHDRPSSIPPVHDVSAPTVAVTFGRDGARPRLPAAFVLDQASSGRAGDAPAAYAPASPALILIPVAASTPSTPEAGLPSPVPMVLPPATGIDRWSGTAYVFARSGGGSSPLAGGGQLGGSQMFARAAYRVSEEASLAARVYSPLESRRGAEAAVGADWHVAGGNTPLRLSVERRIAIGRDGRDAWSAYAAGGFFTALAAGLEADGYGQAGVVGAKRQDLFADGALRIARPVALGDGIRATVGAGVWGAAQPGVERLDIGPRAAVSVPAGGTALSVGLDLRLRVAGRANPGSGLALTIGADF